MAMEIEVKRSGRRSKSIKVDAKSAKVLVSVPYFTTDAEIRRFVDECSGWIEKTVAKVKRNLQNYSFIDVCDNGRIMYLGQQICLKFDKTVKTAVFADNTLTIPGESPEKEIIAFLRKSASSICNQFVAKYSPVMGVTPSKIGITSARGRWGSCCKDRINFSFRLAMAPVSVIEYVVVHELSHMIEMNHSSAFYKTVEKYYSNYKSSEKWLKSNAPLLGKF